MLGTPNPDRALRAVAEVGSLDSRLRGNDDNVVFSGSPFTAKTSPVIAGKRQRDPESRQRTEGGERRTEEGRGVVTTPNADHWEPCRCNAILNDQATGPSAGSRAARGKDEGRRMKDVGRSPCVAG